MLYLTIFLVTIELRCDNLNFKVDAEMRRRIKEYAARHDLSLKEVFEAAIEFYFQHHP